MDIYFYVIFFHVIHLLSYMDHVKINKIKYEIKQINTVKLIAFWLDYVIFFYM